MDNLQKNSATVSRAVIVGCGGIGSLYDEETRYEFPQTHASGINTVKGIELVAICDTDPVRLAECGKARGVEHCYVDFDELLMAEEFDVLSICTPPVGRLAIFEKALSAGIKFFVCEKPIAENLEEASQIERLCEQQGATVSVNFSRRYSWGVNQVHSLIKKRKFGDVQSVVAFYAKGLHNNGSHILDLLHYFFGDCYRILAAEIVTDDRLKYDPTISVKMEMEMNRHTFPVVLVGLNHRLYSVFELDLMLQGGRIKLLSGGQDIEIYQVGPDPDMPQYQILHLKKRFSHQMERNLARLMEDVVANAQGGRGIKCSYAEAMASERFYADIIEQVSSGK